MARKFLSVKGCLGNTPAALEQWVFRVLIAKIDYADYLRKIESNTQIEHQRLNEIQNAYMDLFQQKLRQVKLPNQLWRQYSECLSGGI